MVDPSACMAISVVLEVPDVFSRRVASCLRSTQSVSTLGHTKDRISGPLPPGGKHRDWPNQT